MQWPLSCVRELVRSFVSHAVVPLLASPYVLPTIPSYSEIYVETSMASFHRRLRRFSFHPLSLQSSVLMANSLASLDIYPHLL
jgi:hypothetical protein